MTTITPETGDLMTYPVVDGSQLCVGDVVTITRLRRDYLAEAIRLAHPYGSVGVSVYLGVLTYGPGAHAIDPDTRRLIRSLIHLEAWDLLVRGLDENGLPAVYSFSDRTAAAIAIVERWKMLDSPTIA